MVDKTAFEATVQEYGRLNDRKDVESASTAIRKGVEELLEKHVRTWSKSAVTLPV